MTDEREPQETPGRIDLRALEAPEPFAAVSDRIVTSALARYATAHSQQDRVTILLRRIARPVLAAAVIVAAVGIGAAVGKGRAPVRAEPEAVLAQWAQARHVPTNGELLLAFQGYSR